MNLIILLSWLLCKMSLKWFDCNIFWCLKFASGMTSTFRWFINLSLFFRQVFWLMNYLKFLICVIFSYTYTIRIISWSYFITNCTWSICIHIIYFKFIILLQLFWLKWINLWFFVILIKHRSLLYLLLF